MKRPEPIHLSAEDGEAIIARLSVYAPTPSDCELLIVVMRLHFWLMFALQEAKLSLRRLRNVLFGKAPNLKEVPESEEQTTRIKAPEPTETGADTARVDAVAGGEAGSPNSSGAVSPKPKGGHPAGTGRGQPSDMTWGPMPMWGLSASNATTRSWPWGSAARCVVKAPCMSCRPG
jgi:hypothetical protein